MNAKIKHNIVHLHLLCSDPEIASQLESLRFLEERCKEIYDALNAIRMQTDDHHLKLEISGCMNEMIGCSESLNKSQQLMLWSQLEGYGKMIRNKINIRDKKEIIDAEFETHE